MGVLEGSLYGCWRTVYMGVGGQFIWVLEGSLYGCCRAVYMGVAGQFIWVLEDSLYGCWRTVYMGVAGQFIWVLEGSLYGCWNDIELPYWTASRLGLLTPAVWISHLWARAACSFVFPLWSPLLLHH